MSRMVSLLLAVVLTASGLFALPTGHAQPPDDSVPIPVPVDQLANLNRMLAKAAAVPVGHPGRKYSENAARTGGTYGDLGQHDLLCFLWTGKAEHAVACLTKFRPRLQTTDLDGTREYSGEAAVFYHACKNAVPPELRAAYRTDLLVYANRLLKADRSGYVLRPADADAVVGRLLGIKVISTVLEPERAALTTPDDPATPDVSEAGPYVSPWDGLANAKNHATYDPRSARLVAIESLYNHLLASEGGVWVPTSTYYESGNLHLLVFLMEAAGGWDLFPGVERDKFYRDLATVQRLYVPPGGTAREAVDFGDRAADKPRDLMTRRYPTVACLAGVTRERGLYDLMAGWATETIQVKQSNGTFKTQRAYPDSDFYQFGWRQFLFFDAPPGTEATPLPAFWYAPGRGVAFARGEDFLAVVGGCEQWEDDHDFHKVFNLVWCRGEWVVDEPPGYGGIKAFPQSGNSTSFMGLPAMWKRGVVGDPVLDAAGNPVKARDAAGVVVKEKVEGGGLADKPLTVPRVKPLPDGLTYEWKTGGRFLRPSNAREFDSQPAAHLAEHTRKVTIRRTPDGVKVEADDYWNGTAPPPVQLLKYRTNQPKYQYIVKDAQAAGRYGEVHWQAPPTVTKTAGGWDWKTAGGKVVSLSVAGDVAGQARYVFIPVSMPEVIAKYIGGAGIHEKRAGDSSLRTWTGKPGETRLKSTLTVAAPSPLFTGTLRFEAGKLVEPPSGTFRLEGGKTLEFPAPVPVPQPMPTTVPRLTLPPVVPAPRVKESVPPRPRGLFFARPWRR